MKNNIFILIISGFIAFACSEEPVGQQPVDSVPPGMVTDVKVENTSGGAILTYKLPPDEDLLYVKAVYSRKDDNIISESRSSLYTDTLKVEGFGDTRERQVKLISVDRSRNESPEVVTTIVPLEPAVTSIGKTLDLMADFGGVHGYWDNPTRAEVSVVILKEDQNKEYIPIETFYSTRIAGSGASRGMDTIQANFGIYVQDRWENRSEAKYFTLTPIYETKFDRLKFRQVMLPGDEGDAWSWIMPNMWDDIVGNQGFHTTEGSGRWPHSFTMDLGVTGQISRLKLWQREGYYYSRGNPKKFEVWGCQILDPTGSWESWTKLMDCTSIKPSGLPEGQNTAEDIEWAAAGEEFICSPMNPKVRYIRFLVTENWAHLDFVHISEIQFFGDNR